MRPSPAWTWLVALLLLAAGCVNKDPTADDDAGDDDTTECSDPFTEAMTEVYDEPYNPDFIWRKHEAPEPGQLCFDCHLCANNDAQPVDNTHYVCKHCHDESGGVLDADGCECGDLDCEVDPPILTCGECHTDGCNGHASAPLMNSLCDFCHVPQGPPP